jgi:hypothetical protein
MTTAELLEAVNRYYEDRTRTQSETAEGLTEVRDEIEIMIDTLDSE